ncbi:formate dehydrogenase accessory sulfurtransferase FdhD [Pantanalinema rosaneae CENA516]|uniref:formate dehydrogenase accessory sulfurtransferase FdhD n=1 Tax=Pantanalinema rosaneae TaxID=1620701 RepID=UPI003D6FD068
MGRGSKTKIQVWVIDGSNRRSRSDHLATEEPLEIRLTSPRRTIAITMRTPGADFELTAGFLYGEGVIRQPGDIQRLSYCVDPDVDGEQRQNIINVELHPDLQPNLQPLERHFYTSSACGVCGKASLDALKLRLDQPIPTGQQVTAAVICSLPDRLRQAQGIFNSTGGLHAAALFNLQGNLLAVQEDVGRHNALDKLVGTAFLNRDLPWHDRIVLVSGRTSFEILQKCVTAGVAIVCAVSAPSSLAVEVAREFGITLIGFLRGQRFNVYSGIERIQSD